MYIEKLKLKNFRNYNEIEVILDKKINIFYGNNAEGKTNLLESIYICSTSKSYRTSKENDLINFDKKEAHIKLFFHKGSENEKIEIIDIQLNKDIKKGIAVNGLKLDKASEFLGFFTVILFAPEDLNIIKEGPQLRRKFLDMELCQIDKLYVASLNKYNKTLNQRNAILKDCAGVYGNNREVLIDMLDTYDEQLVNYGIEVIEKRKKNIEELAKKIYDIHIKISGEKEKLIINYENDIINIASEENIKEIYLKRLKETRETDLKNQYTLIGPHRDDISFKIENIDLRKYGSQGQKKTAAISLKLAELKIIKEKIDDTPVLLLDDVFSELDETRQKMLIDNLSDVQTIITCTGMKKNIFDLLKPEKIFQVKNNAVLEK